MRVFFTPHFHRSYHKLPASIQQAFDKPASPGTTAFTSPSRATRMSCTTSQATRSDSSYLPVTARNHVAAVW